MKFLTSFRIVLPSLALTVPAAPVLAQSPPPGGYQPGSTPSNTIPWVPGITSAGRIVFGEIAGDKLPGALALVDGKAYGIFDPEVHKSMFLVETDVNDLDLVAPVGDGPAGMALALSDGVWLYELDTDPEAPQTFVKTLLAAGSFADLDLLRAGAVDGAGRQDLLGASGATVRLLLDSGNGWADAGSFTAGGTVRELVLIDWDSNPATRPHAAVLVDMGGGTTDVEVWELDDSTPPVHSLEERFGGYAPGGFLAAIPPTSADPAGRLAWSTYVSGLGNFLLLLSTGGGRESCGTFPPSPASLTSALYTSSGGLTRVDLLTTSTGLQDTDARMYQHRGGTPPYSLIAPGVTWTAGSAVSPGDGIPAFGDVTGDRVPDALIARAADDEIYFFAGAEPNILKVTGEEAWSDPTLDDTNDRFGITLEIPPDALPYFDTWQVLLWKSEDGTTLNQQTIANNKYGLAEIGDQQTLYMDLDLGPENETLCNFNEVYFLSVRLIRLNGGDTILDNTSAIHAGFAQDPASAANMNQNGLPILSFNYNFPQGCPEPGTPGFVPLPSLPEIENNLPPQILPMSEGPTGP